MSDHRLTSPAIRAAIRAAGEAQTIRQLSESLGLPIARVRNACFNMSRQGILVKSGDAHKVQRFAIGRLVSLNGRHAHISPDAATKRDKVLAARFERREAERVKREAKAAQVARRDAQRAERERRAAERIARQAELLAQRQLREERAAKAKQAKLAAMADSASRRSAKEQPSVSKRHAQQASVPAETVEQWMARTGGKPTVLCRHATAQPFERIRVAA